MSRPDPVGSTNSRPGFRGAFAVATFLLATSGQVMAQGWSGYGHDPQHTCLSVAGSQIPQMIRWSAPVDLNPQYTGNVLYIHYGTPIITRKNSVLVPVKTTASGDYEVRAINGATGAPLWTSPVSDYTLPGHGWVPIFGITLTPKDQFLVYPGGGGTVFTRTFPDSASGVTNRLAFYNTPSQNYYAQNPTAFNNAIEICTPISSDALGNLYFGYVSNGAALPGYPNGIPSGIAKISSGGVGSFVGASAIVGDSSIQKVAYNCAPAFSTDGTLVYFAVNNGSGRGYLVSLDTTTLVTKGKALLYDPGTPTQTAFVDDDGSATPSIGPDGDVYYGVLAYNISNNHYRGFLLHFDRTLAQQKISSAFGWDDTASIVPASAIPSTYYSGKSTYLLLTKYNNYADGGGNGMNQVAILDPNDTMTDPISGATVMKTVITVAGVTPDPNLPGVREWCINSAAIDVVNQCAVINSEDGHVYRWSFLTNSLSKGLYLAPATSEAYTPTVIGPDGAVYAINDAVLFCCVANPAAAIGTPVSPPSPGGPGPILRKKP